MPHVSLGATLTVYDPRTNQRLVFFVSGSHDTGGPSGISVRYGGPDEPWYRIMHRHRRASVVTRGSAREITTRWNLLRRQMRNSRRYRIL